jgi:hypothetical protein
MGSCEFWGAVSCKNSFFDYYCCDSLCQEIFDDQCGFLSFYQDGGKIILTLAGIFFSIFFALVFCLTFATKRKSSTYEAMAD